MARNIQPNEMVGSKLFTTVAPKINSISNERLLFELCLASTTANVRPNNEDLDSCMAWMDTPQGHPFWYVLNREAGRND